MSLPDRVLGSIYGYRAFVSNVDPNGPSKKAGIEEGDVILKFNNIEIFNMSDLPRVVAESDVGSKAIVDVWRKNKIVQIEVTLGELPEEVYVERKDSKEDEINEININSLGFSIKKSEDNKGVVVAKVSNDQSKLIVGDIIKEVNREEINDPENFVSIIEKIKSTGRGSLLLKIIREKESLWVTIKFRDN